MVSGFSEAGPMVQMIFVRVRPSLSQLLGALDSSDIRDLPLPLPLLPFVLMNTVAAAAFFPPMVDANAPRSRDLDVENICLPFFSNGEYMYTCVI